MPPPKPTLWQDNPAAKERAQALIEDGASVSLISGVLRAEFSIDLPPRSMARRLDELRTVRPKATKGIKRLRLNADGDPIPRRGGGGRKKGGKKSAPVGGDVAELPTLDSLKAASASDELPLKLLAVAFDEFRFYAGKAHVLATISPADASRLAARAHEYLQLCADIAPRGKAGGDADVADMTDECIDRIVGRLGADEALPDNVIQLRPTGVDQ